MCKSSDRDMLCTGDVLDSETSHIFPSPILEYDIDMFPNFAFPVPFLFLSLEEIIASVVD